MRRPRNTVARAPLKRRPEDRALTLANGSAGSGYIYSDQAYSHLTFQVMGSRLKPGCAEGKIVSTALDLMRRSRGGFAMTMCSVISFTRTVAAALAGFGLAVVLPHGLSARDGERSQAAAEKAQAPPAASTPAQGRGRGLQFTEP